MKSSFQVEILSFEKVNQIENSWSHKDYQTLLGRMDMEDVSGMSDSEVQELCLMSLADQRPPEAAATVLKYLLKEGLNSGQIDHLSHEMLHDRAWEEYKDMKLHKTLFDAHEILYRAFNGVFPSAEAAHFQVDIQGAAADFDVFSKDAEAPLCRLLAFGMSDRCLLYRLFEDQLAGTCFSEASSVIWQLKCLEEIPGRRLYEIDSSLNWFGELQDVQTFEGSTHPDDDVQDGHAHE